MEPVDHRLELGGNASEEDPGRDYHRVRIADHPVDAAHIVRDRARSGLQAPAARAARPDIHVADNNLDDIGPDGRSPREGRVQKRV
jgi:hypothetical protein